MYYTGFADEASPDLDVQIKTTKELGWKFIETRKIGDSSLAFMDDKAFDDVCRKLSEAGVSFNCFGSGIANWAKPITESPESSYDEMRKAIPRMQKLGIKMARIMSFAVTKENRTNDFLDEVVKRLNVIVKMAEDAGIICVHENCMNWGSQNYNNTLRILDRVKSPNFKLVFDTGNPVFSDDVRGVEPYKKQSAWEFYNAVKDHVVYIHIKDGYYDAVNEKQIFTFPGEGEGEVKKVLTDLFKRGYDGGISIEPHMAVVFHEADNQDKKEQLRVDNYIEYGRRIMKIVEECKK